MKYWKLTKVSAFKTSHSFTHCEEELRKQWINLWTVILSFHKCGIIDSIEFEKWPKKGGGSGDILPEHRNVPPSGSLSDFMLNKGQEMQVSPNSTPPPPSLDEKSLNSILIIEITDHLNNQQIFHIFLKSSYQEELWK